MDTARLPAGFEAVYGMLAALCFATACFVWLCETHRCDERSSGVRGYQNRFDLAVSLTHALAEKHVITRILGPFLRANFG